MVIGTDEVEGAVCFQADKRIHQTLELQRRMSGGYRNGSYEPLRLLPFQCLYGGLCGCTRGQTVINQDNDLAFQPRQFPSAAVKSDTPEDLLFLPLQLAVEICF